MNYDLLIKFIPYVFPGICSTAFLLAFLISDKTFSKSILYSFAVSAISAFFLVVSDALDFYLEIEKQHENIRQIAGSLNYVFRIVCAGYVVRISQRKMKFHVITIDVCVIVNAIIAILNIWTGWIFKMNPDQSYSFGPLLWLPYFIIFIFFLLFLQSTTKYFLTNMGESVAVIGICFICILANALEMNFAVKIVLAQAFSISSVLYYLCLTSELYKRDALTDVFNRRSFFLDARRLRGSTFGVIMLDLNDLKKFNDEEGHKAGDIALLTSVNVLQKVFKKYGTLYRIGGDEFAILIKTRSLPKVDSLLSDFDAQMCETRYRMAYGWETVNTIDNFDRILEAADAKMYQKKLQMKGCKPR